MLSHERSRLVFAVAALTAFLLIGLSPLRARAAVFNPETFTLDNGLQVVVVSNHRAPVVTHMIWYKVGAMDEPPGKSGMAHFLEHLMFKGTDDLKPGEFSTIVARNGGRENAFTTQDYTGYFQSVAVDRLDLMMKLEADRMTGLRLTDEDIEPERRVVLEERRGRVENNPAALLFEQAQTVIYQNHPYRIPTIGWEHEILSLTREDLRRFYESWYAPNNAILVISGDVTAAQVRPLVEKHYGKIPARPLPERIKWIEPPKQTDRRVTLKDPQVHQPSWSRTYLGPSYIYGNSLQAYALEVLSELFGGGNTSRLYQALVVKQGIAAAAGAWYNPASRGPGDFGIFASPKPGVELSAIEEAVEREVKRLLEDGVTKEEVDRAIQRLQASAIYARDSYTTPARILGRALAIGQTVEDVEAWPDRIGAVTVEDVNRAARELLSKKSVTSLLLPDPTS